jgi:hypothetical protein
MYHCWGMVPSEDGIRTTRASRTSLAGPRILGRFRLFMAPGMGQAPRAQGGTRPASLPPLIVRRRAARADRIIASCDHCGG